MRFKIISLFIGILFVLAMGLPERVIGFAPVMLLILTTYQSKLLFGVSRYLLLIMASLLLASLYMIAFSLAALIVWLLYCFYIYPTTLVLGNVTRLILGAILGSLLVVLVSHDTPSLGLFIHYTVAVILVIFWQKRQLI